MTEVVRDSTRSGAPGVRVRPCEAKGQGNAGPLPWLAGMLGGHRRSGLWCAPTDNGGYRPACGVPDDGNTCFQNVPLPDNRLGTHQGATMPSGYDIMTNIFRDEGEGLGIEFKNIGNIFATVMSAPCRPILF